MSQIKAINTETKEEAHLAKSFLITIYSYTHGTMTYVFYTKAQKAIYYNFRLRHHILSIKKYTSHTIVVRTVNEQM